MAAAMAIEDLFPSQADLDRAVEQPRGLGHDDLMIERVALAAEAAAVWRGHDADVRRREVERLGECAVHVVRCLRGRPQDQLAVGIPGCKGSVLLDRKMRTALVEERVFKNVIGVSE